MFCPRCLNESEFQLIPNIINAEHRFDGIFRDEPLFSDEIPGPDIQCTRCNLIFVNFGTHLEIEPDYLPAA